MNNPISINPKYALYPLPTGCAGNRLWKVLHDVNHATLRGYVETFDRTNLVVGPWDREKARVRAAVLVHERQDATTVLLGLDVQRAFGISAKPLEHEYLGTAHFICVPHPSGRNPWYNDPTNRRKVGLLLAELYDAARRETVDVKERLTTL